MARIMYNGKKSSVTIPLPSGKITVKPEQMFEASGKDLAFIDNIMVKERIGAEGMKNHAFVKSDDMELYLMKHPDYKKKLKAQEVLSESKVKHEQIKAGEAPDGMQGKEEPSEAAVDLRTLHHTTLRSMCKKRGIEVPVGTKQKELVKWLDEAIEAEKEEKENA